MTKCIDEVGNRYGKLVVLRRGPNDKYGNAQWYCKCDCGNEKLINGSSLRRGLTISCGCNALQKMQEYNDSKVVNEVGNIYGKLTVLSRELDPVYSKDKRAMWRCHCSCGNECVVSGKLLRNGHVSSCGCGTKSNGEFKIEQILIENKIPYAT